MPRSNATKINRRKYKVCRVQMSDEVEECCRRVSYKVQNQNRAMTVESNNSILTVN